MRILRHFPVLKLTVVILLIFLCKGTIYAQVYYPRSMIINVQQYSGDWKTTPWVNEDFPVDRLILEDILWYDDFSQVKDHRSDRWLAKMFKQFPKADLNADEILTELEAMKYHILQVPLITPVSRTPLEWLPSSIAHEIITIPSIGSPFKTGIYLPPGEGPFPVIVSLVNAEGGQMDLMMDYLLNGFAVVAQDVPREKTSWQAGKKTIRNTGNACIEWIAEQPWCNGKIAFHGYSIGGMTSLEALKTNPQQLTAFLVHIASTERTPTRNNMGLHMFPDNKEDPGWKPGMPALERLDVLSNYSSSIKNTPTTVVEGWYDFFLKGALQDWQALKHTSNAVLVIGNQGHGRTTDCDKPMPHYGDADILWKSLPQFHWLTGKVKAENMSSRIYYFLMGDAVDPVAPGNVWKITDQWPVPVNNKTFYFTPNRGLTSSSPTSQGGGVPSQELGLSYVYDPKNPAPGVGGISNPYGTGNLDQRVLQDRKDILRLETDILENPMEITGTPEVEVFLTADVRDTSVIVKLIDVYPDGYEALITDGGAMARYRKAYEKPVKLRRGKTVLLKIPLLPTAYVFAPGHKIAVHITGSAKGRFTVHPNTWNAIESYESSRTAHCEIGVSSSAASKIILPAVAPGTSIDFDPEKHLFVDEPAF